MQFINPDNEYPRYIGDLKLEHPDFNDSDELPQGWISVQDVELPEKNKDEVIEEGFPIEKDGQFFRNWIVRPMTKEEIERRDAPKLAKQKLLDLGLTEVEIAALLRGLR